MLNEEKIRDLLEKVMNKLNRGTLDHFLIGYAKALRDILEIKEKLTETN